MTKLIGLVGSLREDSLNRWVLNALRELAPEGVDFEEVRYGEVPLYNADLGEPPTVAGLKVAIEGADGVVLVTPEYNYGIPGVLKNALDWASRPAYHSVFAGKPVTVLGASPSPIGTARAQGQLKEVLTGMVADVFPHPEVTLGRATARFDDVGQLTDENTREHLKKFVAEFSRWVAERGSPHPATCASSEPRRPKNR